LFRGGVDKHIREIATKKHDSKVLSIASDELVAKEAKYHPSCYKDYTRPDKVLVAEDTIQIDLIKSVVKDLLSMNEGHVVRLVEVKRRVSDELKINYIDSTESFLKNLKRSIERNVTGVKLYTTTEGEVVCDEKATIEDFIGLFLVNKEKLNRFEEIDKNIVSTAATIRNEIQTCDFKMFWPPSTNELDMKTFPTFPLLQSFLEILITNEVAPKFDRSNQIISSLSQDIFYAVHKGKVLTPKSILLPLLVKSLTNNTELITTISRLGHGISYTKLSELTTEVAYSRISKNVEDGMVCLPEECKKGNFTIIVEDNIDRAEETLTG
jgi:hypothetical protein